MDRAMNNIAHKLDFFQKVENRVAEGTPDAYALGSCRVTWIEAKVVDWPARPDTRIQFLHPPTIHQRNWHIAWTQKRGSSIFLIGQGQGQGARVFAVHGSLADDLMSFSRERLERHETNWPQLIAGLHGKIKTFGMGTP